MTATDGPIVKPGSATAHAKRGGLWRRISRKRYWLFVGSSLAVELGLAVLHVNSKGIIGLTIWAMSGRLRDLGRSGWWVLAVLALMVGFAAAASSIGERAALAVAGLVYLACIVVLGVLPGQPVQNRFGPAPGQPSTDETAEIFS